MWALVISRNHLWHFLQRQCFVQNILEVFGELEILQLLDQFYDRALYYSLLGYEESVAHDHAGNAASKDFVARLSGRTSLS